MVFLLKGRGRRASLAHPFSDALACKRARETMGESIFLQCSLIHLDPPNISQAALLLSSLVVYNITFLESFIFRVTQYQVRTKIMLLEGIRSE